MPETEQKDAAQPNEPIERCDVPPETHVPEKKVPDLPGGKKRGGYFKERDYPD